MSEEEKKIEVQDGTDASAPKDDSVADKTDDKPETKPEPTADKPAESGGKKKTLIIVGVVVLVLLLAGGAWMMFGGKNKEAKEVPGQQKAGQVGEKSTTGDQFSTDPVARGKYLSLDQCTGEGSKKLGSAPMKMSDVSIIEPLGLVAGGHVTPVDHEYFYGKNQKAAASTYDVLAPADGTIVSVEVRPKATGPSDYRVVISYSCTFFSYFDLANSLSDTIAAKMPAGYATKNGPQKVSITVKQGDVLAKVGGQSLDFAVWDTTKTLSGLLVPAAYNNTEPWKINTVRPLDYYEDSVKTAVLPYYVRSVEPRDGKIDYDVDGYAVGNWFKKGTNGYIGAYKQTEYNTMTYADGHLSIAPDFLDPTAWVFSTGSVNHGTQYAIKAPSTTPDKLASGGAAVKYELLQLEHLDQTGTKWLGGSVPTAITVNLKGQTVGTALVQLTAKREMKVEVFVGKTPAQVTTFDGSAIVYTRGDGATIMANK